MEQVCEGYEMLKLEISGGDGKTTLAKTIHGYILWEKCYILLRSTNRASRLASPQPSPSRAPSMIWTSLPAAPQHCPSPSSSRQLSTPSPASPVSPPLPPAKKQKQAPKKQSSVEEPLKKQKQQLKKKVKEAPKKLWDMTYEECKKQS